MEKTQRVGEGFCMQMTEREASLEIEARMGSFERVEVFLEEYLELIGCPVKECHQLLIAVEELVVNVCSYAYPNATEEESGALTVNVACLPNGTGVRVQVSDGGVPFDPLAQDDPDMPASIAEAQVGGMGLLMTKTMMDTVEYEYRDNKNVTTVTKAW